MEILALRTGTARIKPSQARAVGRGAERMANIFKDPGWTELPILAWAILHPDGVILVDTGETPRAMGPDYYPMQHPYYQHALRVDIPADEAIDQQLHAHGITPRDVRTVLLTHLHTDHVGGLHAFERAEVFVHQMEHDFARSDAGIARGYLPQHFPGWFAPRFYQFTDDPVGSLGRSHRVTEQGDVRIVQTPGHTAGHVSVLVNGGDVSFLVAGDATYAEDSLLSETVDGVSPDDAQALATIRALGAYVDASPTVYLPSHDLGSVQRLRTRTVTRFQQPA
jgi:N-acyl homoserine lactone hydrolase